MVATSDLPNTFTPCESTGADRGSAVFRRCNDLALPESHWISSSSVSRNRIEQLHQLAELSVVYSSNDNPLPTSSRVFDPSQTAGTTPRTQHIARLRSPLKDRTVAYTLSQRIV